MIQQAQTTDFLMPTMKKTFLPSHSIHNFYCETWKIFHFILAVVSNKRISNYQPSKVSNDAGYDCVTKIKLEIKFEKTGVISKVDLNKQ